MKCDADTTDLVRALFEEITLFVGGFVAVNGMPEPAVGRLVTGLDEIYSRAIRRLEETAPPDPFRGRTLDLRPHPRIVEFLEKLGR